MEFVLSQKIYEQAKQQVAEGETYDLETLCKNLVNMGYVRQAQVEMPGDFSVRGGILDVFPVTEDCPYRIEFGMMRLTRSVRLTWRVSAQLNALQSLPSFRHRN